MADGVIFTEAAFRQLRRELDEQRREISNLRRNLAHVSTRRHEAVGFIPEYGRTGEAYAPGGTVSTASQTQQNFSSVVVGDELAFGASDIFEVTSGELKVLHGGNFFLTLNVYFTIKHTIDQWTRLDVYLQRQAAGVGAWQYTRLVVRHESNFPNVAVGSNTYTAAIQWGTYNGIALSKDDRLRIVTEGFLSSGSWPSNTSVSPIYLQYAKVWRAEPPPGTVY